MTGSGGAAARRTGAIAALVIAAALAATGPGAPADANAAARKSKAAAPAAAAAAEPERDPWREARTLADAARYDSALAVLRAALVRGDDADLRWLEAGITGEAGRHRESVALYERLAADHPERAEEIRGDLAAERLWADDPAGAARDFRAWLADHPDDRLARRRLALALARTDSLRPALAEYDAVLAADSSDTEVALERARVLGWMGRHGDAIAAYRRVLAGDSTNADARLGLAMNENWTGRHRRATRRLEALVLEPGADPEAGKTLAFARYWDDDPDGARRALDDYLARSPDDHEAQELSRRLAFERRPSVRFGGGRADDSDALRVRTTTMELSFPLAIGTTARLGWRRDNVEDAGGTRDPLRLSAGLWRRWSPALTTYGSFTHTDWGGSDSAGASQGGEAGVVLRPMDRVRLEAAVAREPVLTRRSLQLGISVLSWIGAVDLMANERLTLHADGRAGYFSDHNRSERGAASARLKVWSDRRVEAALTFGVEQLNTRLDLDNGYYDPDFHREWGPGGEIEWHPAEIWTLGAATQLGWQRDKGGETEPFYSVSGRAEVVVARAWTLSLEGGRSDSSLESAAGYERKWWQAAIARGF